MTRSIALASIVALTTTGCLFSNSGSDAETDSGSTVADAGSGGPEDSGTPVTDTGSGSPEDAGSSPADAGSGEPEDAGAPDLGGEVDAGAPDMGEDVLYVYRTSTKTTLTTGIAGADLHCNVDSNKPTRGMYKALIASPSRHAGFPNCQQGAPTDWVFARESTYVNPRGDVLFTTNVAGTYLGEMGAMLEPNAVNFASGLDNEWCYDPDMHCEDWTSEEGRAAVGWTTATDAAGLIRGGNLNCGRHYLVCVEQPAPLPR